MALSSEFSAIAGIGTALTAVGTAVPAGQVRTLIGLRIVNNVAQDIAANVYIRRGGSDYPVIPGITIPAGSSLEGLASSKLVMIAGDQLYAKSSVAASLFVFESFDQDVP